jgi:threonine aldolase
MASAYAARGSNTSQTRQSPGIPEALRLRIDREIASLNTNGAYGPFPKVTAYIQNIADWVKAAAARYASSPTQTNLADLASHLQALRAEIKGNTLALEKSAIKAGCGLIDRARAQAKVKTTADAIEDVLAEIHRVYPTMVDPINRAGPLKREEF